MELTTNQMAAIKKTFAHLCQKRSFSQVIEGDTFDDLVDWITVREVEKEPVDGFEVTRENMELIASLFSLLVIFAGDIPPKKYETEEIGNLFSFICNFKVGEGEVDNRLDRLVETLNRWAKYETPDELLEKEGFRKTA